MSTLAKLGGRVGIMAVAALVPSSRETMLLVAEMERAKAVGRAVGLTDEESSEVIAAWMDWYRTTPYEPDWQRIRDALVDRWDGQEDWRPRRVAAPLRRRPSNMPQVMIDPAVKDDPERRL